MKFQEIILTQTKIDVGLLIDINNKKLKDHCLKYKKNIIRKRGNEITDTLSEIQIFQNTRKLKKC